LIGWQLDLYSSRDWLARGAESALFGGGDEYEIADFPLSELEGLTPATLAALQAAGIETFLNVLDMEKEDFLQVPGIDEEEAERLVSLIDELTVVEELPAPSAEPGSIFAIGADDPKPEAAPADEEPVEEPAEEPADEAEASAPAAEDADGAGEDTDQESVEVGAAAPEEDRGGSGG
jgi:uncharacterized membrane protein